MQCNLCKTNEAAPNRKSCKACRDHNLEVSQARRERLKAAGLCKQCGKFAAVPKRGLCEACLAYQCRHQQTRRQQAKQLGRCCRCYAVLDKPTQSYCPTCIAATLGYRKKRYAERRQAGLCWICAAPARTETSNHCQPCFDKHLNRRYKRDYSTTLKDIQVLFDKQNQQCALCHASFSPEQPYVVDHNHATGQVRGLLCSGCNTALGHYEKLDKSAVEQYLSPHEANRNGESKIQHPEAAHLPRNLLDLQR